jgi:hypothetical protein
MIERGSGAEYAISTVGVFDPPDLASDREGSDAAFCRIRKKD